MTALGAKLVPVFLRAFMASGSVCPSSMHRAPGRLIGPTAPFCSDRWRSYQARAQLRAEACRVMSGVKQVKNGDEIQLHSSVSLPCRRFTKQPLPLCTALVLPPMSWPPCLACSPTAASA